MSQQLNINTNDPQVRKMIGLENKAKSQFAGDVEQPNKELVHLAGDADTGMSSTIQLDGGKAEVFALYRGRYTPPDYPDGLRLTIDVYALPGEPTQVHLICPKCRHQLRATSDRKTIEWEPRPGDPNGGKLYVSPFQCTWEMPEAGEHTPGLISGGLTLCSWKGLIEYHMGRNVVRDA